MQFLNLRKGDRFWYENRGVFTRDQLHEIRKTSLSRTICDNLDDIERLQPYAFLMLDDFSNRRTSCRSRFIPRMDMDKWREEGPYGGGSVSGSSGNGGGGGSRRPSPAFKEGSIPLGGEGEEGSSEREAPVQNSAFLALKKISASISSAQQDSYEDEEDGDARRPPLTPLNPLSPYYLHTSEVPSRPSFGGAGAGFRDSQPRNKLHTLEDIIGEGGGGGDRGGGNGFSVEEHDDSFIIRQDKVPHFRESIPFTAEVPRQLTREQYFRFYDKGQEEESSRQSKDLDMFVEELFGALQKATEDDEDAKFRRF